MRLQRIATWTRMAVVGRWSLKQVVVEKHVRVPNKSPTAIKSWD